MHGRVGSLCLIFGLVGCFSPNATDETTDTEATGSTTAPDTGSDSSTPTTTPSSSDTSATSPSTSDTTATTTDGTGTGGTPASLCDGVYHDWLKSSFDYPDGGVVGIAEVPGTPWGTVEGSPTVESTALVASSMSTVIASQGGPIPKEGARLRFRVTFGDTDNEVEIGFNGDDTGTPTSGIILRASDGAFAVTDGGNDVASMALGSLDVDTEYFVEMELEGTTGVARLSTGGYATTPGSELAAELDLSGLSATSLGRFTTATVMPSNGESPMVDEIAVSRCGLQPPDWEDIFIDEFERDELGNADFPATSTWTGDTSAFSLAGGRLRVDGFTLGIQAQADAPIGNDHARMRAVIRFQNTSAWPKVYWGVDIPHEATDDELSCHLWNNGNEGRIIVQGYGSGNEEPHVGVPYDTSTEYFVEMNVDAKHAVCTVRTDSFTGPVKFAVEHDQVGTPPPANDYVGVGSASSNSIYFLDEMRLSQYVSGL